MKKILAAISIGLVALTLTACGSTPKVTGVNTMAALGDSISVATDSCGLAAQCLPNSWATGTAVTSHAARINQDENKQILAENDAVPGSKVADLAGQIQTAITQKPDYITILIGANDYCTPDVNSMTDPTVFQTAITQDLTTLTTALPNTKIFLASVPNPQTLWAAGKDNTRATQVWQYAGICQSMLANPTDTSAAANARRQSVVDRATAYNTALQTACSAHPTQCHYDGGAVYNYKFSTSELSDVDYFHPSLTGQQKLADLTWTDGGAGAFLAG